MVAACKRRYGAVLVWQVATLSANQTQRCLCGPWLEPGQSSLSVFHFCPTVNGHLHLYLPFGVVYESFVLHSIFQRARMLGGDPWGFYFILNSFKSMEGYEDLVLRKDKTRRTEQEKKPSSDVHPPVSPTHVPRGGRSSSPYW